VPVTSAPIHRDAPSAWAYLVERAGLELSDRDDGIEAELLDRLEPTAASLDEALRHASLEKFSAVARRLTESNLSRDSLRNEWQKRRLRQSPGDALDLWSLASLESDSYLRGRLHELYAARKFTPADREAIRRALEGLIAQARTRYLDIDVSMPQFEELLRLPIWQQRNELYAVWVATEIARALDEHVIKLHTIMAGSNSDFARLRSRLSLRPLRRSQSTANAARRRVRFDHPNRGRPTGLWSLENRADRCIGLHSRYRMQAL
jgi:hypothetical protein